MNSPHAFLELLQTERRYTNDIRTLQNVYLHHLARFPPLDIPHAHCKLITRNTHHLLALHTKFLNCLENIFASVNASGVEELADPAVLQPLSEKVASLFLSSSEKGMWAVYEEYCAGHTRAIALVRSYQNTKSVQWNAFQRYCTDKIDPSANDNHHHNSATTPTTNESKGRRGRKLTFQDYLIMPVQRICRYPLLLSAAFGPGAPTPAPAPGETPDPTLSLSLQEKALEAMKAVIAGVDRSEGEERMRTVRRRLGLLTYPQLHSQLPASLSVVPPTTGVNGDTSPGSINGLVDGSVENANANAGEIGIPTAAPSTLIYTSATNSGAIDGGVELILTGAVQARLPTSSGWEYLAAFLTRSKAPIPTSPTTTSSPANPGKVLLLLARVERAFSSEEDLLDFTPSSPSLEGLGPERWKYEVVWGVALSSSSLSSPGNSASNGVFQAELCNDPPNALRFTPKSLSRRKQGLGAETMKIKVTRRRSKSTSDYEDSKLGDGDKRNAMESSNPNTRARSVSASVVESKNISVVNADDIPGLPAPGLSLTTATASAAPSVCDSPTETTFSHSHGSHSHSDVGSTTAHVHGHPPALGSGQTPRRKKLQKSRPTSIVAAPPPSVPSATTMAVGSSLTLDRLDRLPGSTFLSWGGGLPTIPSPSLEVGDGGVSVREREKERDRESDSQSHSRSHSHSHSDKSSHEGGSGKKLVKKSKGRSQTVPSLMTDAIASGPAVVPPSVSSFVVVSGTRARSNLGHGTEAEVADSNLKPRKSKRKSKIFFLSPSANLVEEPEGFSGVSGGEEEFNVGWGGVGSGTGGGGGRGDGSEGLVVMRTACAGERDVWVEKMKECGVEVIESSPIEAMTATATPTPTQTAWQAQHAGGLARAKSTSAVDADFSGSTGRPHTRFASSTPPEEPPVPELPADVAMAIQNQTRPQPRSAPPSQQLFSVESRSRMKAMSDLGHGASDLEGQFPRSRSSFVMRLPPGISSYKESSTSQSHLRTLSGSSPSLSSSYSFYPYSSLLRGGSKKVFNSHRASVPPPGSMMVLKDSGDVDEGIADVASGILIRKRNKAKMEGETMFPVSKPAPAHPEPTLPIPVSKDPTSVSSATSSSSPSSTPATSPEEAIASGAFENVKRSSTLARMHSVRSMLSFSFGNSISDIVNGSPSGSGSGIRRSMTFNVGGGGSRKGKARFDPDASSSVPTSATNSPVYGTFELPAVVSGEELSAAIGHFKSASTPLMSHDKPLPVKPLPSTPSGLRFKSEPVLPPLPSGEAQATFYFPPSHNGELTESPKPARPRSALFFPESLQSRLWKPRPGSNDEVTPQRTQSKLIPPERRRPVEFIKPAKPTAIASATGSLRIRHETGIGNVLRSKTMGLVNGIQPERRPSLLQRTFTIGRKSKSPSTSSWVASDEIAEVVPEVPAKPPAIPQKTPIMRQPKNESQDSLASAIAVSVRLSRALSSEGEAVSGEERDSSPEVPQKDFPRSVTPSTSHLTIRSQNSRKSATTQRASYHSHSSPYPMFPGAFDTVGPQTTRV